MSILMRQRSVSRVRPDLGWVLALGLLTLTFGRADDALAQASLASEDQIDNVTVQNPNGVKEVYTIVRDAVQREQFYYIPNQPRLYEVVSNGQREPEFALVRYQFPDPANPQKILEGGILQFSATLSPPPEIVDQLREKVGAKVGLAPDKVGLAALPLKEAKVHLYSPSDGLFLASAPNGAGIAPTFASQKMGFSLSLTKIGADVFDTLINGNTGLLCQVEYTYNGLTPPLGFDVEVDWDQTFDFYSRNDRFRAQASYFGLFGGGVDIDASTIRQTLTQNNCLKVNAILGEGFDMAQLDKYLAPILARINNELIDSVKPPDKVDPAVAHDPPAGGILVSAGYSAAMKNVSQAKHGKETISFKFRQLLTRSTAASGFLGIGTYPKPIRDKIVTFVPLGPWQSAYFMLPSVGDSEGVGISEVDLEVALQNATQTFSKQTVKWTPKDGWRDRDNNSRTVLAYPLSNIPKDGLKFQASSTITQNNSDLTITKTLDTFNGDQAVRQPVNATETVQVNVDSLSWSRLDPSSKLLAVTVQLTDGPRTLTRTISPRVVDGKAVVPNSLFWIVEKPEAAGGNVPPINATITFRLKGGQVINWKGNGKDLRKELQDAVFLDDSDVNP